MGEGWARRLKKDVIEAYSAGIAARGPNPAAVRIMAEVGVDISRHRSKQVSELLDIPFDYVVTLCDHAHESCPAFPGGVKTIHRTFDDPPLLAAGADTEEQALAHYRRVRDEIRVFVEIMPQVLLNPESELHDTQ
jgi:arsenate reductase